MSEIKKRLEEFANSQGLNGISGLENTCGFSRNVLYKIGDGVSSTTLMRILEKFPLLNLDWVITGRGHYLITCEDSTMYREKEDSSKTEIHATNNTMNGDVKVGEISELRDIIIDLRKDKERLCSENDYLRAKKDEIWEMYKRAIESKPI